MDEDNKSNKDKKLSKKSYKTNIDLPNSVFDTIRSVQNTMEIYSRNKFILEELMIPKYNNQMFKTLNMLKLPFSNIKSITPPILEMSLKANEIQKQTNQLQNSRLQSSLAIEQARKSMVDALTKINWPIMSQNLGYLTNYTSRLFEYLLDKKTQIDFEEELLNILEESPDIIKKIFHVRFLNLLIVKENWWIFPRISKEEYMDLSILALEENQITPHLLEKYMSHDELIRAMIANWDLDPSREIIMNQIFDNYLRKNYETVVMMLTTQIEGILIDNLDLKEIYGKDDVVRVNNTDLRKDLEKKMKNSLERTENPWDQFIKKANIKFILYILRPLYDSKNFIDDDEINRHLMLHKGIINLEKEPEKNQIIAIRFFLIIDTILYMFEGLNS